MAKHTKHQERIIKNYYKNREAIALQRAQELVTELYLAEGKKLEKHWQSLLLHLEKLEVPKSRLEQLEKKKDPAMAAQLVQELGRR